MSPSYQPHKNTTLWFSYLQRCKGFGCKFGLKGLGLLGIFKSYYAGELLLWQYWQEAIIKGNYNFAAKSLPHMFLWANDDKISSLRRQVWDSKRSCTEGAHLASLPLGKPCRLRGELCIGVLARAEMLVSSVWLMQAMLAKAGGKPWPALITLGRAIILPVTTIRLCRKATFSTFAIINICWNALKRYLMKLLLTMNKALSWSSHPVVCIMLIRVLLSHQPLWGLRDFFASCGIFSVFWWNWIVSSSSLWIVSPCRTKRR